MNNIRFTTEVVNEFADEELNQVAEQSRNEFDKSKSILSQGSKFHPHLMQIQEMPVPTSHHVSSTVTTGKAAMLPAALSSTKSNVNMITSMAIIPHTSLTNKTSHLSSPIKEPSALKSGGRYSALNGKIEHFKRDRSP